MKKRKWSRLEKSLFLVPVLILLAPLGLITLKRDALEKKMAAMTPANAIDCGTLTTSRKDQEATESCALAAVKAGNPFRYRLNGVSSHMDYATIGTVEGQLFKLQYTRRYRHGLTDWEMIEIFRGKQEIRMQRLGNRPELAIDSSEKIYSVQTYWPAFRFSL